MTTNDYIRRHNLCLKQRYMRTARLEVKREQHKKSLSYIDENGHLTLHPKPSQL